MRLLTSIFILLFASLTLTGCAKEYKEKDAALDKQINCATAENDIIELQKEKVRVGEQIKAGVRTIAPIGLVGGLVTGTTGTKAKIATGEYNYLIDKKIVEIREACQMEYIILYQPQN
jgi:hypothetical protein